MWYNIDPVQYSIWFIFGHRHFSKPIRYLTLKSSHEWWFSSDANSRPQQDQNLKRKSLSKAPIKLKIWSHSICLEHARRLTGILIVRIFELASSAFPTWARDNNLRWGFDLETSIASDLVVSAVVLTLVSLRCDVCWETIVTVALEDADCVFWRDSVLLEAIFGEK